MTLGVVGNVTSVNFPFLFFSFCRDHERHLSSASPRAPHEAAYSDRS